MGEEREPALWAGEAPSQKTPSQQSSAAAAAEMLINDPGARRNVFNLVVPLLDMYQNVFFKSNIENVKRLQKLTNTMRNFVTNLGKKNANSLVIKETIEVWEDVVILNAQAVLVRVEALRVHPGGQLSHSSEQVQKFYAKEEISVEDIELEPQLLSKMLFDLEFNRARRQARSPKLELDISAIAMATKSDSSNAEVISQLYQMCRAE